MFLWRRITTIQKKTIKVPELEELARKTGANTFSEEEDAIITEYYYRVTAAQIADYLNKTFGKEHNASHVQKRATKLRLRKD